MATVRKSSSRGRALTRRIADYFGLSYPREFTSAVLLLIALIFLRVLTVLYHKFGADEPQHLHVIWGWARGFVQYRDLADNHMPLFQILFAPIYKLIGDRGTILLDAGHPAIVLRCRLLVHLSHRVATFFPARRRLGSHSSGTFLRLCFLFG